MGRRIREIFRDDPQFCTDHAEPRNWVEGTMLLGIKNGELLRYTQGEFPRSAWGRDVQLNGTHPLFLVERIGNWGMRFFPCSSSEGDGKAANAATCSFVRKGTLLLRTGNRMPKTTYLIHSIQANLEADNDIVGREHFFGVVPESGISGTAHCIRKAL